MLGIPTKNIEIDLAKYIVFKGLNIYGVVGRRIYDTWYQVKDLIDNNMLDFDKIITHTFKLTEFQKAMELMGSGNCGKIVLLPGDE
jgi:threonine 3-dehydrogenase